jgi:hypothetical protein
MRSYLVYASFAEFKHYLSYECAWITLAVVREAELEEVSGGMSCFIRQLVKHIRSDLSAGAPFKAEPETLLLQVDAMRLVCDEAAIKQTFASKGASGIRCCIRCQNVLSRQSCIEQPFVHISESDPTKFIELSDNDAYKIVDRIAEMIRSSVPKTSMEEFCANSGFNYVETGVTQDREARVLLGPSKATYDPMHIYYSNGILGFEVRLLFESVDQLFKGQVIPVSSKDFIALAQADWVCDPPLSASQRKAAAELAVRDKVCASRLLSIMPLLDYFVRSVLAGYEQLRDKVKSMIALCEVVRAAQALKKGQRFEGSLLTLQSKSLQLFVEAYGKDWVRPKHHFQFHIASQVSSTGAFLDCFCAERKHQAVKKAAKHQSLRAFSENVLTKLLQHEIELLKGKCFRDGLDGKVLQLQGLLVSKGTCLLLNTASPAAFLVEGFLGQEQDLKIIGECWSFAFWLQWNICVFFVCRNAPSPNHLQINQGKPGRELCIFGVEFTDA